MAGRSGSHTAGLDAAETDSRTQHPVAAPGHDAPFERLSHPDGEPAQQHARPEERPLSAARRERG